MSNVEHSDWSQEVSGLDFSVDGRLASCSHDRTAYVWTRCSSRTQSINSSRVRSSSTATAGTTTRKSALASQHRDASHQHTEAASPASRESRDTNGGNGRMHIGTDTHNISSCSAQQDSRSGNQHSNHNEHSNDKFSQTGRGVSCDQNGGGGRQEGVSDGGFGVQGTGSAAQDGWLPEVVQASMGKAALCISWSPSQVTGFP